MVAAKAADVPQDASAKNIFVRGDWGLLLAMMEKSISDNRALVLVDCSADDVVRAEPGRDRALGLATSLSLKTELASAVGVAPVAEPRREGAGLKGNGVLMAFFRTDALLMTVIVYYSRTKI